MTDYQATQAPALGVPSPSLISTTLIVYVLFAAGAVAGVVSSGFPLALPLVGFLGIGGVILAYVKRDDAAGSWLASHYRWLIRTFWFSLLWGMVGGFILITLGLLLIGIPIAFAIWFATTVWVAYRLIRGWVLFKESRPMPGL